MALAVPADFDAWTKKALDASVQDELVDCVEHAQAWIARQAGLRSLEKESADVTEYLDSDCDSWGQDIWLPMSMRPVWHTGSDTVSVSVNGSSMTLATGYSSTASVSMRGVNTFSRVRLSMAAGWSWGSVLSNNISVACKVGFDGSSTATTNACPADVKRLVMEVAYLMFNGAGRVGVNNTAKAGSSANIVNDLSPMARETLDYLRGI